MSTRADYTSVANHLFFHSSAWRYSLFIGCHLKWVCKVILAHSCTVRMSLSTKHPLQAQYSLESITMKASATHNLRPVPMFSVSAVSRSSSLCSKQEGWGGWACNSFIFCFCWPEFASWHRSPIPYHSHYKPYALTIDSIDIDKKVHFKTLSIKNINAFSVMMKLSAS